MAAKLETIAIEIVPDADADTSYLDQDEFADRRAEYDRGDFGFVGIRLRAEISIPDGKGWILQSITTPGLWSIEDDSGQEYFESVAADELGTLRGMLEELNVDGNPEAEFARSYGRA